MGLVAMRAWSRPERGLRDVLLAGEALVLLGFFRAALSMAPARTIIGRLTRGRCDETAHGDVASQQLLIARRVRWAVSAAVRRSPVEFVCFPQALAGYTMLRRRGVASTLMYGVARSEQEELLAHAWLMMGETVVLGGDAAKGFTPVERWT
jgi:hypothetical protein